MAASMRANGRRRGGRGQRHRPMAEINVTPFVDVMLVLLVIFMVAAPLLTVGVPLELPQTAAEAVPQEQQEPVTLSITSDGSLVLMENEVPEAQLIPSLQALMADRTSKRLFLRVDTSLPYGRVMQVMGALDGAGYNDLVLVTEGGGPTMGAGGTTPGQAG